MPDVTIRYKGDSRDADSATQRIRRGFKDADGDARKASSGFGEVAKNILKVAAASAAFAAVVKGAKYAVNAAVDLNEQINKTGVVFGKASGDVIEFSKTTASSLGISQRAALEAAGTFGNMLVPMGFARESAAKMSTNMVKLAADMASFNNADPTEVLEALRSGLAGETEPLRKFGIFLNDARLKAEAMALGIYNGKGALDAASKAQATYSIILKDSADAQGDFGRTSDSLANQQRILKAEIEQIAAAIGAKFIPLISRAAKAMTDWLGNPANVAMLERVASTIAGVLTTAINNLISFITAHKDDLANLFQSAIGVIGIVGPAIAKVAGALLNLSSAIGDQKTQLVAIGIAWIAWKTGAITAAAQAAAANIVAANTTAAAWRAALVATGWGALAIAAGVAIAAIIAHWDRIKRFLSDWKGALNAVKVAMVEIGKGAILLMLGPFVAAIDLMLRAIEKIVREANKLPIIGRAIPDGLADGIKRVRESIEGALTPDFGKVKSAFRAAGEQAAASFSEGLKTRPDEGSRGVGAEGGGRDKVNIPTAWGSPGLGHAGGQTDGLPLGRTEGPRDLFVGKAWAGTNLGAPEAGTIAAYNPTGAQGGGSMYFVGASGTTYWLGHIAIAKGRKVGDKVGAGDVIAVIADTTGEGVTPHLHIDKTTNKVNIPGSPSSGSDPLDTGGGTTTTVPAADPAKPEMPSAADAAEIAKTTGLITFIGKHIEDALEATRPKLTASLKGLREIVKDALKDGIITDEELAKIRSQAEKLNEQLARSIRTEDIRESLTGAREKISELVAGGFITPAAAQKMRASIDAIAKMIREAVDPKSPGGINVTPGELAAIEKRWADVTGKIQQGVADAAAAAAGVAKVKAAFRTAMKDGVLTDAEIDSFLKGLDGLKGKVAEQMRGAAQAVLDGRESFRAAWDKFMGYALQAFDRATAALRKDIVVKVKVEGSVEFDFKEGDLTPTEQEIYNAEKARQDAEFKARKEAAANKLQLAKDTGEGIAEAQREWDDLMYEEWKAGKEKQAAAERAAATATLATAQQNFDDLAAQRRIAFETELRDIGAQMANGELTYDQGLAKIKGVFAKYETPFSEQGSALGTALQSAMLAAFGALEKAMDKLATAIDLLVKRMGGKVAEAQRLAGAAAKAEAGVGAGVGGAVEPTTTTRTTSSSSGMTIGGSAGQGSTEAPGSTRNPVAVEITNPQEIPTVSSPTRPGQQEFARGGIVRARNGLIAGTYTPMDSLLARVSHGEMILNPRQQAVLFALANGRGEMGRRSMPPVVNVNFPGFVGDRRDLMRAVRTGIESVIRSSGGIGW